MYNLDDLLKLIKKTAMDAVRASKPADVVFGTITSISPLTIKVDQKLELKSAQLILTKTVTDIELTSGEKVIMMQASGGQKYVVLDRIGKV